VRHAVDALELEGQHFAHVADDQLEAGVGVKETGGVEAQDVEGGVFVPAPAGDGELEGLLLDGGPSVANVRTYLYGGLLRVVALV